MYTHTVSESFHILCHLWEKTSGTEEIMYFILTAAISAVCLDHVQEINRVVKAAIISIFILTMDQTNICKCERSRSPVSLSSVDLYSMYKLFVLVFYGP